MRALRPLRALHPLLALGLAAGATGCSGQNQSGDMQVPAVVSGVVEARPPCRAGQVCPFVVALVPDAVVEAEGKDGTHWVRADAGGHYHVSLLVGTWTLTARRTTTGPAGPPVRVQLSPGGAATVNLQVS